MRVAGRIISARSSAWPGITSSAWSTGAPVCPPRVRGIVPGGTGIGFAVPINLAKELLPQLRADGKVSRGWLGVSIQNLSDELAENFGAESHLTWFASMDVGEEIVINYQAATTSEGFSVRIGEDEYQSGYGLTAFLQGILGKAKRGGSQGM